MNDGIPNKQAIKDMQDSSRYMAMVVRNAMEEFHHKYLSDNQMKELNPIIRNAIYTAIFAYATSAQSEQSRRFVEYHLSMIPSYWEESVLLEGFKRWELP